MKTLFLTALLFSTAAFATSINCSPAHDQVVADQVKEAVSNLTFAVYDELYFVYGQAGIDISENDLSNFNVAVQVVSSGLAKCGDQDCLNTVVKFSPNKQARITHNGDVKDFSLQYSEDDTEVISYVTVFAPHQTYNPFGDATGLVCETRASELRNVGPANLIYDQNNSDVGMVEFSVAPTDVTTPIP